MNEVNREGLRTKIEMDLTIWLNTRTTVLAQEESMPYP